MSYITGYKGVVLVGVVPIAQIREVNISETVERMDATVMGVAYEQAFGGLTGGTVTINCYQDPTDTTGQGALTKGASVTIVYQPDGAGSGLPQSSIPAIVETVERPQNPREHAMVNFSGWINGIVDDTPQT